MAWNATVVVLYKTPPAKDWGDTPVELQSPSKERGDVICFNPDGDFPTPQDTCPYVFIRVTGIPDTITLDKINSKLRNSWDKFEEYNGNMRWRCYAKRRAQVDVSLLPLAARQALNKPGGSYEGTFTQFLAVCNLKDLARKIQAADLE